MAARFISIPSKAALGATAGGLLLGICLVLGLWLWTAIVFGSYGDIWIDPHPLSPSAVRGAMIAVQQGALVGLGLLCAVFPTFWRRRWGLVLAAILLWFFVLAIPDY